MMSETRNLWVSKAEKKKELFFFSSPNILDLLGVGNLVEGSPGGRMGTRVRPG